MLITRRAILATGAAVLLATLLYSGFHLITWPSKDSFVMLTVEEASSSALNFWPLAYERRPNAFLDLDQKRLILASNPRLLGVRLGVHYSAFSGGVLYDDRIVFSRSGRASLGLDDPISFPVKTPQGNQVEAVSNDSRVIRGNLVVTNTAADGKVTVKYGQEVIVLAPGQTFSELLASTPSGVVAADEEGWDSLVEECIQNGYPMTRLSITNFGLWPKSSVEAGPI